MRIGSRFEDDLVVRGFASTVTILLDPTGPGTIRLEVDADVMDVDLGRGLIDVRRGPGVEGPTVTMAFREDLSLNPWHDLVVDLGALRRGWVFCFRSLGVVMLLVCPALPLRVPVGPLGEADGQAGTGGELPGVKTCCHSRVQVFAHGQCSGRCRVALRCGRASRAGTLTS